MYLLYHYYLTWHWDVLEEMKVKNMKIVGHNIFIIRNVIIVYLEHLRELAEKILELTEVDKMASY